MVATSTTNGIHGYLHRYAMTWLAVSVLVASCTAATALADPAIEVVPVQSRVEIDALAPEELMIDAAQSRAVTEGAAFGVRSREGLALVAEGPDLRSTVAATPMIVHRELTLYWQIYMPYGLEFDDLDLSYEMVSDDGRNLEFSHQEGDAHISVDFVTAPPRLIRRVGSFIIVEGRVSFDLDVGEASTAGTYSGMLTLTVN